MNQERKEIKEVINFEEVKEEEIKAQIPGKVEEKEVAIVENNKEEVEEVEELEAPVKVEEVMQEEKTETPMDTASEIEEQIADGIKVVLFQSKTPLPADHFIFLRHKNVVILPRSNGKIFYMIEGFKSTSEAFKFLNSFIIPDKKYKGSFVAKIENGVLAGVSQ